MAGLEDVIQGIGIEGGVEVLETLKRIEETGVRTFEAIAKAAEGGDGSLEKFGLAVAGIEAALGIAAGAALLFVESQDRLIQRLGALSEAFGASIDQIEGIKEAFASAGVGGQMLERSLNRMAISIGQQWSEMQREMSGAADVQEHDMTRVQEAALGLEKAYDRVREASTSASQASAHDALSQRGAALALEAAQNKLFETPGAKKRGDVGTYDTSAALKEELQYKQDQFAVDKAIQAVADANLKSAEDSHKAFMAQKEAALGVKKAKEAEAAAAEKQREDDLKNLPKIVEKVDQVAKGYGNIKDGLDLSLVPAQKLAQAVIQSASAGGEKPTGLQVFTKMTEIFHQLGDSADDTSIKMELVQRLMGAGFRAGTSSASELVAAISKGPEAIEAMVTKAENSAFKLSAANVTAAKDTVSAWASFGAEMDRVQNKISAELSPMATKFLRAITEAFESDTMKDFISGLAAIKGFISDAIDGLVALDKWLSAAFEPNKSSGIKVALETLSTLALGFLSPWIAIPIAIALVVIAMGKVVNNADKIKEAFDGIYKGSWVEQIVNGFGVIVGWIMKAVNAAYELGKALASIGAAPALNSANPGTTVQQRNAGLSPSSDAGISGLAGGGPVRGPGSGTSDSITARLSNGEFVMKAAAVRAYGMNLFEHLNNMVLPGFAMGGPVLAPIRAGAVGGKGGSVLNLTIDGTRFEGLHAPTDVAAKLTTFAIGRQTAATGRKPSWVG